MIRTSKHNISDITNISKLDYLDKLFIDYKHDLEIYINYIIDGVLPLKNNLSSALLPNESTKHSRYKQIIYKQASSIIRSQLDKAKEKRYKKYKVVYAYFKKQNRQHKFINIKFSKLSLKDVIKSRFFTIPKINDLSINLDERFFNMKEGKTFDNFINIKLPYFNSKETRALQINIPIKNHKHSNKLKNDGFLLKDNIQIKKVDNLYYINFVWERQVNLKPKGKTIGIDTGYRKLIATSDNQMLGTDDMLDLYKSIVNKKRNSKEYKNKLKQRDNLVNELVNKIDLTDVSTVVIEDLNNVKHKSKYNSKVNDLLSRWTYRPLLDRIMMRCEVNGIALVKVSPAYTSQTCSSCGACDKNSRNGDSFLCTSCGYEIDADLNASINIRNKGAYSPLDEKS